jgi:hypothetical protein
MRLINLKSLTTNPYRSIQVHQALRQLANITVGILLAKSMLALEEIGMFEQLLFIGYVLTYFLSNGLAQAFLTEYPRLAKGDAKSFLDQVYQIHLTIAIVLLLVLFVGEIAVKTILVSNPGLSYYTYFSLYLVIYFPAQLWPYFLLVRGKTADIFWASIVHFILYVGAMGILPFVLGQFDLSFKLLIGISVLSHFYFLVISRPALKLRLRLPRVYVRKASQLTLYAALGGFAIAFDGWLVNWQYQSEEIFAQFRYGARELPIVAGLAAAVGTAALPMLSRNLQSGLAGLKRESLQLFQVIIPLGCVLALTSNWFFPLIFRNDFAASAPIFNVMILVLLSKFVYPQTVLMALDDASVLNFTGFIELILNVGLSIVLMQVWGVLGIVAATVAAYIFEKIALIVYLYRIHKIQPNQYIPWQSLFVLSGLLLLCVLVPFLT